MVKKEASPKLEVSLTHVDTTHLVPKILGTEGCTGGYREGHIRDPRNIKSLSAPSPWFSNIEYLMKYKYQFHVNPEHYPLHTHYPLCAHIFFTFVC